MRRASFIPAAIATAALLCVLLGTARGAPESDDSCKYVIQEGDTFWSISEEMGTTEEELMALNSDVDPEALQVGDEIRTCDGPSGGEDGDDGNGDDGNGDDGNGGSDDSCKYMIQEGDTLWSISKELRTTVEELMALNSVVDSEALQVGDKIRTCDHHGGLVDGADGDNGDDDDCTYEVEDGDTFWDIAEAHGTTVKELEELNPDIDPEALQTGDMILMCGKGLSNSTVIA